MRAATRLKFNWFGLLAVVLLGTLVVVVLPSAADQIQANERRSHTEVVQLAVSGSSTQKQQQQQSGSSTRTQTPVIGVLSQVLRDYKKFADTHKLHIASSYVKWIEMAGAQVVPVLLNQEPQYYEQVFNSTHGLLLPGGDNLLDPNKDTPMMVAARQLYALAVEANRRGDHYPIWGTCLGMELLTVLSSGRNDLESCEAVDESLAVNFVQRGKMFAPEPSAEGMESSREIMRLMAANNVTYNHHRKCITEHSLERAKLDNFYRPLAYSRDVNQRQFIAIFEAVEFPFFGVQFHPEKAMFEFVERPKQLNIPHSRQAIAISRYLADFFVRQAQQSGHRASEPEELAHQMAYAYQPLYTAPMKDIYEQRYLFPFKANNSTAPADEEEFLEFVPTSDDQVPEDVAPVSSKSAQVQV